MSSALAVPFVELDCVGWTRSVVNYRVGFIGKRMSGLWEFLVVIIERDRGSMAYYFRLPSEH